MIPEIGHFALILALALALLQGTLPLIGAHRGNSAWIAMARPAALGQFTLVVIAFAALTHGFVTSDFSLAVVVENSHSAKPMLYKVSGTWGNHEGSLLLWLLILTTFGAAVALFGGNLPTAFRARVLAVQSLIGVGFLLFTLLTSNPFERVVPAPPDGLGLNPLLQDPGLAFHPPFLYLGYVGFSMAFSFAVAALIEGRVEPAWARWVRPWTLAAWCFLTTGIALGSWWAYYELGWGGFWFWDPVENASFMPWLAGTALLHSAIVVEKRDTLKSWTILLAIVTFSLSLLGTFLVRSSVLTSVHAFASDPARGVFILLFLLTVIGVSLSLYAIRAPALKARGLFAPISREGALVLNNLLLSTAAATVLLGTLYPLFLDALSGEKISVGPPFFNRTFVPLMVPVLAAMAVAPLMAWKRADLWAAVSRLRVAFAAAGVVALGTWYWTAGGPVLAVPGMALAVWLMAGAVTDIAERVKLFRIAPADSWRRAIHLPRAAWGAALAHGGLGVVTMGLIAATAWPIESQQVLRPGDRVELAGYTWTFGEVEPVKGPNYTASRGTFTLTRNGDPAMILAPEARRYPTPPMDTTEAAIRPLFSGDLFAMIGNPDGNGGWATRIFFKPLMSWVWAGAVLMVLGGLVSLSDRRHRVGAPARRRRPRLAAQVAGA